MFTVSETASDELKKVFETEENANKSLILYFMGAGWSGPALGMALDESTDGLEEMKSNGISAYIDPKLNEYLSQIGDIKIDYITNEQGSGYTVKVGDPQSRCDVSGCSCWHFFSHICEGAPTGGRNAKILPVLNKTGKLSIRNYILSGLLKR